MGSDGAVPVWSRIDQLGRFHNAHLSLSALFQHVQILVALNLSEVLRVYAPNAPYAEAEMIVSDFIFIGTFSCFSVRRLPLLVVTLTSLVSSSFR